MPFLNKIFAKSAGKHNLGLAECDLHCKGCRSFCLKWHFKIRYNLTKPQLIFLTRMSKRFQKSLYLNMKSFYKTLQSIFLHLNAGYNHVNCLFCFWVWFLFLFLCSRRSFTGPAAPLSSASLVLTSHSRASSILAPIISIMRSWKAFSPVV